MGHNQELVLFSRFKNFKPTDLYDSLYHSRFLMDGWDKMMGIYVSEDFPKYEWVRKMNTQESINTIHWRKQDESLLYMDQTLEYVKVHGPLFSKDYRIQKTCIGKWGSSNIGNICLNHLWTEGLLGISEKKNTSKKFDLIERVYKESKMHCPYQDIDSFMEWYIKRRIQEVGAIRKKRNTAWLGCYLWNDTSRNKTIETLLKKREIVEVKVKELQNETFYVLPESLSFFTPYLGKELRLLAPLDNLIWDREMVKLVFDFEYSWEVYIPPNKRKYGYYVLPILYKNKLVGRVEPKWENKEVVFKNIWLQEGFKETALFKKKLESERIRLTNFLK